MQLEGWKTFDVLCRAQFELYSEEFRVFEWFNISDLPIFGWSKPGILAYHCFEFAHECSVPT